MLGAILGDTIGSIYEFNNHRSKKFELLGKGNFLTDDSIMTLAVMEIMQRRLYKDKDAIIDTLKKWGRAYPNRGYGGMFALWLGSDMRESYNSYGNGAAMRISPVGYYCNSEEEVIAASRAVTEVTHSHPNGIKGAEVVAMCIYYAKLGKSKNFIKSYVDRYYSLDFNYEDLKRHYRFNETCEGSIPQAIWCFLNSSSYEDTIRTVISIGGDCDTTASIAGGIAEAYYKHIDLRLIDKLKSYIPSDKDGCRPMEVLNNYLADRVASLTGIEEINEKTFILAETHSDGVSSATSYQYSKCRDILIDYVYEVYEKEGLNKALLLDLDNARKGSFRELNNTFLRINKESKSIISFTIYNSPRAAIIAMGEDAEMSPSLYSHIFNTIYLKNENEAD